MLDVYVEDLGSVESFCLEVVTLKLPSFGLRNSRIILQIVPKL